MQDSLIEKLFGILPHMASTKLPDKIGQPKFKDAPNIKLFMAQLIECYGDLSGSDVTKWEKLLRQARSGDLYRVTITLTKEKNHD